MSRSPGRSNNVKAPKGAREEPELEDAYDRLLSEAGERLGRPLLPLVATGLLGGVDVGVGVLAYLLVEAGTGNEFLAALAFSVGFVALLLAHSELFTENFLVPVIGVVAKVASFGQLIRLWGVTLVGNLVAGLLMMLMVVVAEPQVQESAVKAGSHFAHLGVSWRSFFLAVLAGAVMTLLTRMQHSTEELSPKIVAAVMMAFVLVAGELFHSILDSLLMFAGILTGDADYNFLDWLGAFGWAAFGNLLGGLVLVTSIRLLRVPHRVQESREERS